MDIFIHMDTFIRLIKISNIPDFKTHDTIVHFDVVTIH